jgi:hypothetical protein
MPKLKDTYRRVSTWDDLNAKLVKHYRLPHGSKFAIRRNKGAGSSRPFLRADTEVRRKLFRKAEHPREDNPRISDVCRRIEAMLAPSSRSDVVALEPNGGVLDGKKKLKTWQKIPGKITQDERDVAEMRRLTVEEIRRLAVWSLSELEEGIEDPHTDVTEAVLRALIDRYGDVSVREAIRKLRL